MKNIFTEIEELKGRIQADPRNPSFRYQLGELYLEIRNTQIADLILEYLPRARDEFVYALALDKNNIRALCKLAETEDELWKLGRKNVHARLEDPTDSESLASEVKEYDDQNVNRGLVLARKVLDEAKCRELDAEEFIEVAQVCLLLDRKDEYERYMDSALLT